MEEKTKEIKLLKEQTKMNINYIKSIEKNQKHQ